MVNSTYIILIKGENILVLNNAFGANYKLPIISLKDKEDIKEVVNSWTEGKIKLNNVKIIEGPNKAKKNESSNAWIMVDASEGEAILNPDSGLFWTDATQLNIFGNSDTTVIKQALEHCISKEYTSVGVKVFKTAIERKMRKINYFKEYKEKLSNRKVDEETSSNKKLTFILFSIMSGILFSLFFFHYIGISFFIYVGYLAAGFLMINGVKNKSFLGYFLLLISIILSTTYAIFTNHVFRTFNLLVIPISLFSSFVLLTYNNVDSGLIIFSKAFFERIVKYSSRAALKLPEFSIDLVKHEKPREGSSTYRSIALGLSISVPIVVFLCILLAGADGMFSYYLSNLTNYLKFDNISLSVHKIVWTILVAFFTFGFYWSLFYKYNAKDHDVITNISFEPVIITTILVVVSLLYLVFTKVQVSFLYGSKQLPPGYTYADYARNGFFQLVFIVVINLLVITILKFNTKKSGRKQELSLNILYTIITLLTFNMAFSAIYKMNLYIDAFGYTRLRLLVQVFTVFLILVLGILTIFIWKNINLFKPIICVAAVIYVSLNFFNIDNYIAKRNIEFTPTISNFDANYLSNLSLDAAPSMGKALEEQKISSSIYDNWLNNNEITRLHWYEYNYYASKVKE